MITTIHAHKGGQGTTTITATLALLTAGTTCRTLLVDTGHDLAAILDLRHDPHRPGLSDHLQRSSPLAELIAPVTDHLHLLAAGTHPQPYDGDDYQQLADALASLAAPYDQILIDTGGNHDWHRHGDRRILVTRPDYLALRHSLDLHPPTHVVVVDEPGRSLTPADISAVLGLPITATIPHDLAIARAIDAGQLATRTPRTLTRALKPLTHPLIDTTGTATKDVAQ